MERTADRDVSLFFVLSKEGFSFLSLFRSVVGAPNSGDFFFNIEAGIGSFIIV